MSMVTFRKSWLLIPFAVALAALGAGDTKLAVSNADLESFAEPYRTIQVASGDTGIIREVLVREGEAVEAKQPLVKLDDELVKATLEIARQHLSAKGALQSAQAELRLHTNRHEKIDALLRTGHARPEELDRALMDKDVAEARVLAVQETLIVRQRELDRIQIELENRIVRSPRNGVVIKVHREVGEFVAPTDPVVVTVAQLDPLLATFSLRLNQASQFHAGGLVQVQFASAKEPVEAEVEFVSPVTDAKSGTVRVKVRIPNPAGECRSGERCTLVLAGSSPASPEERTLEKRTPKKLTSAERIR